MALTDHCHVFGAVHEEGINLFVKHIMEQRPSLFNYGTEFFLSDYRRLCCKVNPHPEVLRRNNPVITVEDPIAIPGTNNMFGLNFCVQLSSLQIDLHPGGVFALPPELPSPLAPQTLALRAKFCAGIGCPSERTLSQVEAILERLQLREIDNKPRDKETPPIRTIAVPHEKVHCFSVELFAVAHLTREMTSNGEAIAVKLDGLEIVDINPKGLENSLECFMTTTLRLAVLPKARITLETLTFELGKLFTVGPTPISAVVPNNPAVEDNQIKVFLTIS